MLLPSNGSSRCATEIELDGHLVAMMVHDAALLDQRELIAAVAPYAQIALENQRLVARLESSLRESRESRARVVAVADRQRRGIERDLHDGAQQRLVALRIKLQLAEDLVREDPERGVERLHALGDEVSEALEEIRALARGVYPSLLADRGLPDALRAAALQATVPAVVVPDGVGRYPQELESAVYFCCLEGLQNASKHAKGATRITVKLFERDGAPVRGARRRRRLQRRGALRRRAHQHARPARRGGRTARGQLGPASAAPWCRGASRSPRARGVAQGPFGRGGNSCAVWRRSTSMPTTASAASNTITRTWPGLLIPGTMVSQSRNSTATTT